MSGCPDPTVPLDNVFQCFPTLVIKANKQTKNNPHPFRVSYSPTCFPLPPDQSPRRLAPPSLSPPTRYVKTAVRSLLSPLLLRLERPHSLTLHTMCSIPLNSLMTFAGLTQCSSVFLVLRSQKLDTALEM